MNTQALTSTSTNVARETPGHHDPMSGLQSLLYAGGQAHNDPVWRATGSVTTQQDARSLTSSSPSNHARYSSTRATNPEASDHAPLWAEMKTKAGKERKRLPLACIACRRKKIRCSGEKPACKHCLKSRTPCVYKLSVRKVGPRTDYMAMLDKRLKRMEERVIKIIPKEEFDALPDVSRAIVKPSTNLDVVKKDLRKRTAQDAFGPDLDKWARAPSKRQNGAETSGRASPRARNRDESSLLLDGEEYLPPFEIQEHLAETYFEYVYGQSYHLLHKPSFMRKLKAGTVPPVLLLAVCAVSARFSKHPALDTEPAFLRGLQWSDAAREIALRRFDNPNITILTVFVLLGLHEFGTCQGGRSWMLGGMAIRMAYALQLHKDLTFDPTIDRSDGNAELTPTDREIRRRTMWACFVMDRFNSSGTQRPLFSYEEYLELQLPIKEQYFVQELSGPTETLHPPKPPSADAGKAVTNEALTNMGVAAYTIRIIALFGRIVQYVNLGGLERDPHPLHSADSGYTRLQTQVAEFEGALPPALKLTEENLSIQEADSTANQFLYLHIVYHGCVLFINRMNSPAGAKAILDTMSTKNRQETRVKAILAAGSISQLLAKASRYRAVAPFAGYCAYTSSLVHIHAAFSHDAAVAERSKQDLKINIEYLSDMKKYWGNFHFLMDNLRELWKNYADLASKGTSTPNPKLKAVQYGDWYDRYPNGVTQGDFQVPRDGTHRETGEDAAMGLKANPQSVEQFFATLSPEPKGKQLDRRLGNHGNNASAKASRRQHSKKTARRASQRLDKANLSPDDADFDLADFSTSMSGFPESYARSPIFPQQRQPSALQPDTPQRKGASDEVDRSIQDMYSMEALQNQPVPQLGTQMRIPSFGEMDATIVPDISNSFWDMEFDNVVGGGVLAEPSNAWFMPFNLSPPALGGSASDGTYFDEELYADGQGAAAGQMDPRMPSSRGQGIMDMHMGQYGGGDGRG